MGFRHVAALALLSVGCATPAVTELIVVVDTDLRMPAEIDHLSIAVTGPSGMSIEQEAALTGDEALPFTLNLVPSGDALGPIEIVVSATRGTSTVPVVSRRASVTLVRGEARAVLLHLARSCLGVTCPLRETCTESGCARIDMTPVYTWTGAPPRLGQDAGPAIDGGRDGGSVDAGPNDASVDARIQIDSGPDCTTLGCDDDNPCTSDVCDTPTRACQHRPLDIACDDEVFCNGFDRCGGGTCSVHDGNPCLTGTTCAETLEGCMGCTSDAMCPAPMMAEFGECTGTDSCGAGGTHARIVRTFACVGELCTGTDAAEAAACTIDRTGTACAPSACGEFGSCGAGPGGTCATDGVSRRTCTDHTCTAAGCTAASREETTACTRATDGIGCGGASCEGWSGCANDGSCSTAGTHSRSCTTPTCAGGACTSVPSTESEGCFAGTDGNSCGAPSCDGWSACSFADVCTTSGTHTRTCYAPVCSGGGCASGARTESEGCSRGSTDGTSCGGTTCSAFACTGGYDFECDQDRFEQRTCQDAVCAGGGCVLSAPRVETGAGCFISTDGQGCSAGGFCPQCYSGGCYDFCT